MRASRVLHALQAELAAMVSFCELRVASKASSQVFVFVHCMFYMYALQAELASMAPSRDWRLIEVDSTLEEVDIHRCAATCFLL
jgi:hypothetical protein